MWFRQSFTVQSLFLPSADAFNAPKYPVIIELGGKRHVRVELRPPDDEERRQGFEWETGMCSVFGEYEPPRDAADALVAVESDLVPRATDVSGKPWWLDPSPPDRIKPNHAMPRSVLAQPIRSFLDLVDRELTEGGHRTVRVLRWRTACQGPHQPFAHLALKWSVDGQTWSYVPTDIGARMSTRAATDLRGSVLLDVQRETEEGGDEPLAHALFREAWEQRHRNPRSALTIGVVAAETGLKELASRSDELRWLLRELPSPPVDKMLREFIPIVIPKAQIPDALLDEMKKAVHARNHLVHKGQLTLSSERVETMLEAVRDLLFLFDHLGGKSWALGHVSGRTRAQP